MIALIEHGGHVGHLGGVEMTHVKARQTRTKFEHANHVCHINCVEVAHVKARQL